MNNHPSFQKKESFKDGVFEYVETIFKKYKDNTFRLVGYDLKTGDTVFMGLTADNIPYYKKIDVIIDQRPSSGDFPNHNRPTSYQVTLI